MTELPQPKSDPIYRASILQIIQAKIDQHPRSAQIQIGPSEVGGCPRKVGFKLSYGGESSRPGGWAAYRGTVLHAEMDDVFKSDLAPLMPDGVTQRFFSDLKLAPVCDWVNGGTLDLYDALFETVIDWKFPGSYSIDLVRKGKVSEGYYTQAQIYGLGLEQTGQRVSRVALMFLPIATDDLHGTARGAIFKYWDYDRAVAWEAIEKIAAIKRLIDALGPKDAIEILPKRSDFCASCPASATSGDRRATCPGVSGRAETQTNPNPFA